MTKKQFSPSSIEKSWAKDLEKREVLKCPQEKEGWEEELMDKLIYIHHTGYNCQDWETYDMMKSFIRSLLQQSRQQLLKEIEEMLPKEKSELAKKPFGEDKEYDGIALMEINQNIGWNGCLTQIKEKLKKLQ